MRIAIILFSSFLISLAGQRDYLQDLSRVDSKSEKIDEHPRPLLQRRDWVNLSGGWKLVVKTREDDDIVVWEEVDENSIQKIIVPFSPESKLSGLQRLTDPSESLWYQRDLPVKPVAGEKTILHFDAVDYEATVWVNDTEVGRHVGGHTPFSFDVTNALKEGENKLTVRVNDATEGFQLNGKQALNPKGITYTRVSGIWQTVWLEQVPERSLEKLNFGTKVEVEKIKNEEGREIEKTQVSISMESVLRGTPASGERIRVGVSFKGEEVTSSTGGHQMNIEIPNPRWWTPDTPNLYDLQVEVLDGAGKVLDSVKSYTALRTVGKIRGKAGKMQVALNGREIFLFGPLDQGWWADGLLTPPSEEAMVADLQYIKDAGFNMVRKHVKVENARYYYHCDRLGLAVWQDHVSAGLTGGGTPSPVSPVWTRMDSNPKDAVWPEEAKKQWIAEYQAMVDHLRNHPSILIWSLFNESWGQHDSMDLGKMAVDYDKSRLVCLASGGNFWPVGDIASHHNYTQPDFPIGDPRFRDYILACGEMGGFAFRKEGHQHESSEKSWGHGGSAGTEFEWKESYARTIQQVSMLREQGLAIAVYTQTSDVENEINGFLTYDRVQKVPPSWLKSVNDTLMREKVSKAPQRRQAPQATN